LIPIIPEFRPAAQHMAAELLDNQRKGRPSFPERPRLMRFRPPVTQWMGFLSSTHHPATVGATTRAGRLEAGLAGALWFNYAEFMSSSELRRLWKKAKLRALLDTLCLRLYWLTFSERRPRRRD
jgi:hypothetical protein